MKAFNKVRGLLSRLRHHHAPKTDRQASPHKAPIPEKDLFQHRQARNNTMPAPRAQSLAPACPKLSAPVKLTDWAIPVIQLNRSSQLSAIYCEGNTLGSGMSGPVMKAVHIPSGQLRAVKRIKIEPGSEYLFRGHLRASQVLCLNQTNNEAKDSGIRAAREVCGLLSIDHPSIVKLHEIFLVGGEHPQSKKTLVLGMEFIDGRDLLDETCAAGHLSEERVATYILPVVEALIALHRKGLVHRDVKANNILCLRNTSKLIDLGFTRHVNDDPLASLCGSESYAAPELWRRQMYDGKKADVWSLGVTMYAVALGRLPFEGAQEICGSRLYFPASPRLTSSLENLIERMLDKNPKTRPTMEEVLAHPWMQSAKRLSQ